MEQKSVPTPHKDTPAPSFRHSQPPVSDSKDHEKENENKLEDRKIVKAVRRYNNDANPLIKET
jgi:hypothetical protein